MKKLFVLTAAAVLLFAGAAEAQRAPRAPQFNTELPKSVVNIPVFGMYDGLVFVTLQTVTNPTIAEFTASTDHSTVENGTTLLSSYRIDVLDASNVVKSSRDIGKPTPAPTTNLITYNQLASMLTSVTPGTYTAKVYAVGPGGATASAPSNPFSVALRSPAAPAGTPVVR